MLNVVLILVNLDNKVGTCGFMPLLAQTFLGNLLLRRVYPIAIVKVNEDTGELVRNSKGLCLLCGAGTRHRPDQNRSLLIGCFRGIGRDDWSDRERRPAQRLLRIRQSHRHQQEIGPGCVQ